MTMVIMMMMKKKYKTNKCHKFVTLIRFIKNDRDDHDADGEEI